MRPASRARGGPASPASEPARARLERICAKNPTSILFARLADAYLRDGRADRAAAACRKGLRYRPSYATGHLVMAACHRRAGWAEGAREEYGKVLQLDAGNLAALIALAEVEEELGRPEAAARHRRRALALDPFHPLLSCGRAGDAADPDAAPAENGDGAEAMTPPDGQADEPDVPFATPTLARLYAEQGHADAARAILERVLRERPDHPEASALMAELSCRAEKVKPGRNE